MSDAKRILDLLAQGKITVDEAEQLLKALASTPAEPARGAAAPRVSITPEAPLKYLRVVVQKTARPGHPEKQVSVRVPLALVRSGMRLGAMLPGYGEAISQRLRERGLDIDLTKSDPAQLEAMLKTMGELSVDVDGGKARVLISCE